MTFAKRWLVTTCALAAMTLASEASAQFFMTPQQNAYQAMQSAAGRAANPWMYGAGANPYSPVMGGGGYGGMANPYAPNAGYDPFLNPYYAPSLGGGGVLYGEGALLNAYANVVTSQEQARILREQAMQAKIDTARKRFDFDLYVRANTPTYADEQKKIAKQTLKRIQVASNPAEIASGKALNILLDDVRNFPNKKANMDPLTLSDDVLKQLNVTTKNLGVGILRHEGKFTWPVALADLVPLDQQKTIEKQVQIAVADAAKGKIDGQLLADIGLRMDTIKKLLTTKVNDLKTTQYLEADRFLSDFRDSRQALEEGQMVVQDKFNRFVQGGKTMQELADFMVNNGLKFAPGGPSDEGGYRALHSALVAFDIALNTAGTPPSDEKN